jgi:hypothetical protein
VSYGDLRDELKKAAEVMGSWPQGLRDQILVVRTPPSPESKFEELLEEPELLRLCDA